MTLGDLADLKSLSAVHQLSDSTCIIHFDNAKQIHFWLHNTVHITVDRILSDNEFFNGRVADLSKMQRYEKLKLAAQWMNDHSMEVVCVDIDKPSQSRPNVVVSMELRRLSSLRGRELKIFSAMNALADTVFLSGLKDEAIRFSFGIESLWQ